MKKFLLILSLTIFIVIVVLCFGGKDKSEFIRININANSNLQKDTEVRKIIKDEIVEFLNSYIEGDYDREKVKNIINEKVKIIECIINGLLIQNKLDYKSSVNFVSQYFNESVVNKTKLESGFYDCLKITLGRGEGDNLSCVLFPSKMVSVGSRFIKI